MADVDVSAIKEQLNQVIRDVLASYENPKVLYMPQAGLTLPCCDKDKNDKSIFAK